MIRLYLYKSHFLKLNLYHIFFHLQSVFSILSEYVNKIGCDIVGAGSPLGCTYYKKTIPKHSFLSSQYNSESLTMPDTVESSAA